MNYGIKNEYDFVDLFNNKYFRELDYRSKMFLKELYGDSINSNILIKAWKNKMPQKADIFIKVDNHIKGISLKCGNSNSMHQESVQDFKRYLEKLRIPYNVIDKYMSYHYGYMKDEDNNIDFSKILSADEYKNLYQSELDVFNKCINKTRIIVDMIDRFLIRGRNADYDIDALICGTCDNFEWIMKDDLYDLILSKRCADYTSPHIACLTIGPKKRNLNRDSKNWKDKYIVCIRWDFIKQSIIDFKDDKDGTGSVRLPSSMQKKSP